MPDATEPSATTPPGERRGRQRTVSVLLGILLFGVAILGPAVAFAGVSIVWPASTISADVNDSPPLTVAAGDDFAQAGTLGFASDFTATNNAASFTTTVSGLSGGTIIIDEFLNVTADAALASYKVEISSALAGTLSTPETLKLRFWTGETAPTADGSAGVCAVLDLKAALDTESAAACTASAKVQVVYELPDGATGSSDVGVRFSSIVFA